MAQKPKVKTLSLEKRLLSKGDIHKEVYHGRKSAWDFLKKREENKLEDFTKRYLKCIENKWIWDRVNFIESRLKRSQYRPIEVVSGGSIEDTFGEEAVGLRKSQKFYVKFEDSMIIAIQLGVKPIEEGANFSAAHIDSPGLKGRIQKLQQNFNISYMLARPYAGIENKDFFGRRMSLFFRGCVTRGNKDRIIKFKIGENNGDPSFYLPEESVHLGENDAPGTLQLKAVLGNKPYPDKGYDPTKRVILNVMNEFHERYGLTEYDLLDAEIWLLPQAKPCLGGIDKSTVIGYGQDNMASAYALLHGFLAAKKPKYTKIAIFYDREEVFDVGRGSLRSNFVSEIIMPALAYLTGKNLADHYTMAKNSWSLFLDVAGAIHLYDKSRHDVRDSPYLDSGVIIEPVSGEEASYSGFESPPEVIRCMRRLFEANNVVYQFGAMGNEEGRCGASDDQLHNDIWGQNITMGIPLLGMHRAEEQTSVISNYQAAKAVETFFAVENHKEFMPEKESR